MNSLISDTNGLYLDCTFGRGGHSKKILEELSPEGRLISFDLDDAALEAAKSINHKNFRFIKTNFSMICLLYTSPSPRDAESSRMPSSA